jgi:hypothetical protein
MTSSSDRLVARSPCPFATAARLEHLDLSELPGSPDKMIPAVVPAFRQCIREAAIGKSDGLLLEIEPEAVTATADLARAVFDVITCIGQLSSPPTQVKMTDLYDSSWWFRFDNEKLFVIAFDGRSSRRDQRYTFGAPNIYLLFQHRNAFRRRFGTDIPDTIRQWVRSSFRRAGLPYNPFLGVVGPPRADLPSGEP